MVFQSITALSAQLKYVSDGDGGFKQPLERCKLLTRWVFEYFDQTRHRARRTICTIRAPAEVAAPVCRSACLQVIGIAGLEFVCVFGHDDIKEDQAHLDQNMLARYAALAPAPRFWASRVASLPAARMARSAPTPLFGANLALENRD